MKRTVATASQRMHVRCAFTSMKQHASSSRNERLNLNLPLLSSSAGGTHCRVIGHVLSMEEKKTLSR